jgi:hypothetical protein
MERFFKFITEEGPCFVRVSELKAIYCAGPTVVRVLFDGLQVKLDVPSGDGANLAQRILAYVQDPKHVGIAIGPDPSGAQRISIHVPSAGISSPGSA